MKKLKFLPLLLTSLIFASCGNDDEPATDLALQANGSYTGYTAASCGYFKDVVAPEQTVTVTSSAFNKVDIICESDTWGTITITGAELTGTADNIRIAGSGTTLMGHAGNAAKEYECTVAGSLIGKNLELTFSVPAVMGGLEIEFRQGAVPASLVVPGTYSGYTEAKSAYFSGMMADNQQITVTANADNTYKIDYVSDTWGEFTIEKAAAAYADGEFTVKGSGVTKMGMNGNVKDYDCTVEATIDAAKTNPAFTFSVPAVMGGLSIIFHTGDMPEAE